MAFTGNMSAFPVPPDLLDNFPTPPPFAQEKEEVLQAAIFVDDNPPLVSSHLRK